MQWNLRPRALLTRGRVCKWYDEDGNCVMMSLDVWSPEKELETTVVCELGPFDSHTDIEATFAQWLTAQGVLF